LDNFFAHYDLRNYLSANNDDLKMPENKQFYAYYSTKES